MESPEDVDNDTRDELLSEVGGFLVTVGYAMMRRSGKEQDEGRIAIATCVQLNGDLAQGIRKLIAEGNYYSSLALGRQVLETTQMIQYFTKVPARGAFWLTATDAQMRNAPDFKPKALRAATASSDTVYSRHCFMGGHPRSVGRMLLPGSPWRRQNEVIDLSSAGFDIITDVRSLLLADSLQHLYGTVLATITALDVEAFQELGALQERSEKLTDELVSRLVAWRGADPLAMIGPDVER
jgi:hypothetical protein